MCDRERERKGEEEEKGGGKGKIIKEGRRRVEEGEEWKEKEKTGVGSVFFKLAHE